MPESEFKRDTVVADAIAADPAVVERLATFHPAFTKLRNRVLRRVMARLVTFEDAARVAGVPVEAVLAAARGEAPDATDAAPKDTVAEAEPEPGWVAAVDLAAARRFDARALLARGEEPLGAIMREAREVAEGGDFVLEAPFDPAPLHRVLARKGFSSHARMLEEGHWRVFFRRDRAAEPEEEVEKDAQAGGEARSWSAEDGIHIDVRGLPPPEPMLAILRLLERPDTAGPVIVHHEREPVFLYPELAERGWRHRLVAGAEGEVRLELTREAP